MLYQLGPECSPSSITEVESVLSPAYMECMNGNQPTSATIIGHEPLTDEEFTNLVVTAVHRLIPHIYLSSFSHSLILVLSPYSGPSSPTVLTIVSRSSSLHLRMLILMRHLPNLAPTVSSPLSHTQFSGSPQPILSHDRS